MCFGRYRLRPGGEKWGKTAAFVKNVDIRSERGFTIGHRREKPVTVTQAEAKNTATTGHQVFLVLQQVISVGRMLDVCVRQGEEGGKDPGSPRSVQRGPAPVPAGFLAREVPLARPVISPAAFQLPTFSCVNF